MTLGANGAAPAAPRIAGDGAVRPSARSLRAAPERVLANADLVLDDAVRRGSVLLRDGAIAAVDTGASVPPGAEDCDGQLLLPGFIELHTDNLERHLMPRPGVKWPGPAAVLSHDGELAAAGITTVFDAVRVGSLRRASQGKTGADYAKYARDVVHDIAALHQAGLTRIDHRIHLRAEVCSQTVLEEMDEFGPQDGVAIVSIMDHTPGQRQFSDLGKFRQYHQGKYGLTDAEMEAHIVFSQGLYDEFGVAHEQGIVARARALGATLASHDDTTAAHVARSVALSVDFAEFPTTEVAAAACRAAGIPVMMGAPNVLRGGSHSGNVSAMHLAEVGLLDVLSSDYAPSALLLGVLKLADILGSLPAAVATVTRAPAMATGLADRGRIAPGLRADLVRVARHGGVHGGVAAITGVWRAGAQVG
ncbi:MAG: alpha-D-ribose 1-methylphosphonate 5-triphosphate diphosphatase [Pseudomonadota bacterium]